MGAQATKGWSPAALACNDWGSWLACLVSLAEICMLIGPEKK
jgi:hypothetical protein